MNDYLFEMLLPVMVSFLISVLIGPGVIKMLKKLKAGQTEREEGLESHQKKTGTPTMGGVIFIIPFVVIGAIYGASHKEVIPVLIMTIGFGIVGFVDDYIKVVKKHNLGLRAWQKLAGQIAVVILFFAYVKLFTDISLDMKIPFTGIIVGFGIMELPVLLFGALGTANGTNFTDGVDGLCGSVTAVVAAFFAFSGLYLGAPGAVVVSSSMVGALLGYLIYNVYPGKVMMGDTGSLAIGGFVIGVAYVLQMPIFILIAGFVYFFEVVSVIIQVTYFKATNGKRFFRMAPIHHHFEKGGWSETRVVNVFTTVTLLLCLLAYAGL